VWLISTLCEPRIFANNDGLFFLIITLWIKMPKLKDTCVWDILVSVVHDSSALKIPHLQNFGLKIDGSPSKFACFIIKKLIDRPRKDNQLPRWNLVLHVKLIHTRLNMN